MALVPCATCLRHIRTPLSSCPFCGAIVGLTSLAAAASLAVAGCGPATTPEATTPPPVTVTPSQPAPDTSGGSASTEPVDTVQPELPDAQPQPPEPEPQLLYGIDMKKP